MNEWFTNTDQNNEPGILAEVLAFFKPHLFGTQNNRPKSSDMNESEVKSHPLLDRFMQQLERDPGNEYLIIQIEEYKKDHGID